MAIRKKHDFGTFPDLWRHRQITLFCRICDLAYRSNETFFSRTRRFLISRSAWPLRVSSINDKNDDENAAHVRNGMVLWRSPETVVSRTASSRVQRHSLPSFFKDIFSAVSFLKFSVSWYHRVTEHFIICGLHSLSKLPQQVSAWLSFLACQLLKQLPTFDTYLEYSIYPTAHPVSISPDTFYPKSNQSRQKTSFLVFHWNSKSPDRKVSKGRSTCNMPSGSAGQALLHCKVWMTPLFKCSSYVENKKVREKKIKKITQKKFLIFNFS